MQIVKISFNLHRCLRTVRAEEPISIGTAAWNSPTRSRIMASRGIGIVDRPNPGRAGSCDIFRCLVRRDSVSC